MEVAPSDGRPPYTCYLLGFKDGVLDLQLESGEARQENAAAAKSIRFLPPPPTAARAGPAGGGPGGRAGTWNEADARRLRELGEHEGNGALTPADTEELRKLKERAPVPLLRWETAKRKLSAEAGRWRIDKLQRGLREATQEEEARGELWVLAFAYTQKGTTGAALKEALQKDVESIAEPALRRRMAEELGHMLNWFAQPKPWRKDR